MSTPLYIRSEYSLLSSTCKLEDSVLYAKKLGYNSLAIVDKNTLSYAKSFYAIALKNNIKPIFGMEIEMEYCDEKYPICLYARNDDGFKNLMKLSSNINCNEEYIVDKNELNKYKDNNFVVFMSSYSPIKLSNEDNIDNVIDKITDDFGSDILYGICDNDIESNRINNKKIKAFLAKHNIKTIALSHTYYLKKEDAYSYEVLKCIRDKMTMNEVNYYDNHRYLMSNDEYRLLYDENDLKNNDVLAHNANVTLSFKTELPVFKTPNGIKNVDYLVNLARKCLDFRLSNNVSQEYTNRLNYELKVIVDMGFVDYFLIVYDYIKYAKSKRFLVGPGRGSGAGSLVAYALGITDVDPIKYGLLFERFLNPERITMPDIDTDFPDDKRDLVIDYVKEKYGKEHVAHIVTYGTMKAKQVIRDVGRALNIPLNEVNSICKTLPQDPKLLLSYAYENINSFRQRINISDNNRKLFEIATKLEGLKRHYSTHASGIVFSKDALCDVCPLIKVEEDIYSTQYTMEYLEDMGLIKMDFLAIKNLSVISEICDDVRNNIDSSFDIHSISLNDEKTFKLINDVQLLGVFQLESSGMQGLAYKMHPKSFEEIGMMIALFRPGPMENIPEFLKNRSNPNNIKYITDDLKPILEETYGIIVYQEQIMNIARIAALFSLGKADILRRAMSKKKADILINLKNDFIEGCLKNNYTKDKAEELYNLILKFANYGFNKSHSVVYALVCYMMAYLKANYPLYFYKALLNESIGASVKTSAYIKEILKHGIKLSSIDINKSKQFYYIDNNNICLPFYIVKDVGQASIDKILEERSKGLFANYVDAVIRLTLNGVSKNVIANLIYAGAFDSFNYNRYTMSESLDNIIAYTEVHKIYNGYNSIGDDAPIIKELNENKDVCANKEKEVLGFYFAYNPINEYRNKNNIDLPSLKEVLRNKGIVKGFGHVTRVYIHTIKRSGEKMAYIDVEDDETKISITIMPRIHKLYENKIKVNDYIVFEGKNEDGNSIIVNSITIL